MTGHAIGTHEAALRLALGLDFLPDPFEDRSVIDSLPFGAAKILDLGCGQHPWPWVAGGPSYIHGRALKVTVDRAGEPENDDQPELWRDEHIEANLDKWDRNGWPDGPRLFDVVIGLEVIEHIENPWRLLRTIAMLLAPGGVAVISTPDVSSAHARDGFRQSGQLRWFPDEFGEDGLGHITPIFPYILREMASRSGLEITGEAWNEPPPHWASAATPEEIAGVTASVRLWRFEHAR